jgi:hypothetical protein
MATFKSILKPENSVVAGIATIGAVYSIYQLNVGSTSNAQATDANHPILESSRRKAGYTALVLVAALTLITKDGNVGILGGGTIIAMELSYRHAIMAHPTSGKIQNPSTEPAFQPAENVYPIYAQGETG